MFTIILGYVVAAAGVVMIVVGAWGLFISIKKSTTRPPLRYYAIWIGMICNGVGLLGIVQALRLLLVYGGP
jgi:hypothetical protein